MRPHVWLSCAAHGALACVLLSALACDDAELVSCGRDGIFELFEGVQYCVYPGAAPGLRCPGRTMLVGEFEGGIVCASRPAPADSGIADRACRHLEGGCARPARPPDSGVADGGGDAPDAAARDAGSDATTGADAGPPCSGADCGEVVEIAAGFGATFVRLAGGAVYGWGSNWTGMLGDGSVEIRPLPVALEGLGDVTQLGAGWYHTCAVRRGGGVSCWGENREGVLGEAAGGEINVLTPLPVVLPEAARAVSAGRFHNCALGMSGAVYCWGSNEHRELGDDARGFADATPAAVPGVSGAIQIGTRYLHSCALRQEATERVVTCWGANDEGQVGSGSVSETGELPTDVLRGDDLAQLAVGSAHTCVRRTGGAVDCWGAASIGETGDPDLVHPRLAPFRVPGLVAQSIDAGTSFTCALVEGGQIRCWGANALDASQLGAGSDVAFSATALVVRDVVGATLLATGPSHACAALAARELRCWGSNQAGQLGNGEVGSVESAPVAVVGLP